MRRQRRTAKFANDYVLTLENCKSCLVEASCRFSSMICSALDDAEALLTDL